MIFDYATYSYLAIGLGMVISLFLTETLGVMAGGIIVPGYIALHLHEPAMVIGTFTISLITYGLVILLSKIMLIYGRRRLILSLLIGFLIGYLCKNLVLFDIPLIGNFFRNSGLETNNIEIVYIGYIIPGLIASWMDKQGIIRTVSVILIVASIVNLIMMYLYYFDQFRILYV